jgi:RNA recognition motif-containing protein
VFNMDDAKPRADGRPGVSINGLIPNVLFVSRFPRSIRREDVEAHMTQFGTISDVTVRGEIAFVDFVDAADAMKAKIATHRHPGLGSDSLICDFKKDKPFTAKVIHNNSDDNHESGPLSLSDAA